MPKSKPPIRKPGPPRPQPVGWRPYTQEQRAMWFELGGPKWVRRLLDVEIDKAKGKVMSETRCVNLKLQAQKERDAIEAAIDYSNRPDQMILAALRQLPIGNVEIDKTKGK